MRSAWLWLVVLAACHDDKPSGTTDGAVSIDGEAATGLVGTWNRLDDPPPDSGTLKFLTFTADGMIHTDQRDGIWREPSPGRLHIADVGDTNSIDLDYVIDGTTFAWNAFLPVGTPAGFVGTWDQFTGIGTHTTMIELVLAADHTLAVTINGGTSQAGTWAPEGTGLKYTYGLGDGHLRPVGAALSPLSYARE